MSPGRLNEALPQIEARNHLLKIRDLSHLQSFLYLDDALILLHICKQSRHSRAPDASGGGGPKLGASRIRLPSSIPHHVPPPPAPVPIIPALRMTPTLISCLFEANLDQ
jgi:hypothetical protein